MYSSFAFTTSKVPVVMRFLRINVLPCSPTPTLAVFSLGGTQLIMIVILCEYLGRIYDEVKRRPHYIVAERIAHQDRQDIAAAPGASGLPGVPDA